MGGKESNTWQKDIGESGATDHQLRSEGDAVKDREHQEDAEQKADERAEQEGMIPKRGENPGLAEIRERKAQSTADRAEERSASAPDDSSSGEA